MRLFALIVGLFLAAVLFAAGSPHVYAQEASVQEQEVVKVESQETYVKVKSGDNLTKIAKAEKTTYKRIFYANKQIKNPDLIYPGQKLRIPDAKEELKKRKLSAEQKAVALASDTAYKSQVKAVSKTSAPRVAGGSVWDRLAGCESGGNWSINTGNGYYGGLQFSLATWRAVGGTGYPHQHSREEQIKRGQILQARSGWGQWPACTLKLGLR